MNKENLEKGIELKENIDAIQEALEAIEKALLNPEKQTITVKIEDEEGNVSELELFEDENRGALSLLKEKTQTKLEIFKIEFDKL